MLRLTETEIRDTLRTHLKAHNIRVATINLIMVDLQDIEAERTKHGPNGLMLRVCRYLEDGESPTARQIARALSVPTHQIHIILSKMRVFGRVSSRVSRNGKYGGSRWFIEKPGIDYIHEKAARGY